ncbi:MAG: NAD(P)H-dependent oxidoreductase [Burkholderiales bacterium]|nr:MAG: NAD(P)H-dependent oxidoreductase [Burkholderiales bacterium]
MNPDAGRLRLIGVSGSLRRGSYNAALLRAAAAMLPADVDMTIGSIRGIPLYDADVEADPGPPAAVTGLRDAIARADGLLLVTPEYNNSIPGVFKNAIDWLSSPAKEADRAFGGRPVAIIGASSGGFGTILAQSAWLPVLRALGAQHWSGGRLMVSRAGEKFDASGTLVDRAVADQLTDFLQGFAQFVRATKGAPEGAPDGR